MSKTVLVPIANGTEEIEAVCMIDTLRRAGAQVTVASVDELQITASRGVNIVADTLIADCADNTYDLIALPGGMPGAEHLRDSAVLTKLLHRQKAEGHLLAAICASPAVVLHHHRLVDGLRVTCHPSMMDRLDPDKRSEERVIVDGICITSRGPGTALEFAIKLIEALFDAEKALKVAGPMLVK